MRIRIQNPKKIFPILLTGLIVIMAAVLVLLYESPEKAEAWLHDFNPANMMSDFVMTNKSSMTEAQIQQFLKSKNSCDDRDRAKYDHYTSIGVQYSWRDGHFVCMADESFNGESAARIIWQAGQDFGINPQVLIVLLQKEQGLVTDTWPNWIQYKSATGYACPDSAPCDSQYYGFKNQVRNAARFFRAYQDNNPSWYKPYWIGENNIHWSPNESCGTSRVNIENRTTASLYGYTPYRPNQTALNSGWGTGDSCSAYGNRNFYNYFTEWFGGTQKYSTPLAYGTYSFFSKIDVNKAINADVATAKSQLWDKSSSPSQDFVLEPDQNGYYFISHGGKVLDISSTASGTPVILWNKHGGISQKWIIKNTGDGYYEIYSACDPTKVLDFSSTQNGTDIIIYNYHGGASQRWQVNFPAPAPSGDYVISSKISTNKSVDVGESKVQIWDKNNSAAQQFKIVSDDLGYYTITHINTDRVIGISSVDIGISVALESASSDCRSKWIIKNTGDGYYEIYSACDPTKVLDFSSTQNGTDIIIYNYHGGASQRWGLRHPPLSAGNYSFSSKINTNKAIDANTVAQKLQIWDKNGSIPQNFTLEPSQSGYYFISYGGKVVDISSTASGTPVILWGKHGADSQRWNIKDAGDGYYEVYSVVAPTKVLDFSSTRNGTDIIIYNYHGGASQRWSINKEL